MARITRSTVLLWLADVLGLQSAQGVPTEIENKITPVVEITPRITTVIKSASLASTGTGTIYTTPSDKDFFLTYANLTLTKNVSCDLTSSLIQVTVGGAIVTVVGLNGQTLTVESLNQAQVFAYPVKLDRASTIVCTGAFTVGACSRRAQIGGYIFE